MKMLRVKLKNLNNLRRVGTELYVDSTSLEKNWEAVLKSHENPFPSFRKTNKKAL